MGSDPLPNNLEYTLSLSLDDVITNIDAVGTTTTLTGNQYTEYSNASEASVAMIIDDTSYQEFVIKEPQVNPLNLPANTLRVRYAQGTIPASKFTKTLVDSENNIYDLTYDNNGDWSNLFQFEDKKVEEILGINSENITNMKNAFARLSISTIPLFDTSSVTNMSTMFSMCSNLETVPLFNTSKVTDMGYMFDMTQNTQSEWDKAKLESIPVFDTSSVTGMMGMCKYCGRLKNIPVFNDVSKVKNVYGIFFECRSVETGILSLYNKFSALGLTSYNHTVAFYNCGINTQNGQAELAQIPSDWKEY